MYIYIYILYIYIYIYYIYIHKHIYTHQTYDNTQMIITIPRMLRGIIN